MNTDIEKQESIVTILSQFLDENEYWINRMTIPNDIKFQNRISELKTENEKLKFMIDNGLGWQDMINDISYPPRD